MYPQGTLDALEERLRRLEGTCRWQRRLLVAAAAVVGSAMAVMPVVASRAAEAPTLEARRFVVRDAEGRERAVLGVEGEGARLLLRRADGSVAVDLSDRARSFPLR